MPTLALFWILKPAEFPSENGGAKRDRTADLLRARQALSQLSYSPKATIYTGLISCILPGKLVGLGRFERPTSPLSGVRSNQLSYRPNLFTRIRDHGGRHATSPTLYPIQGGAQPTELQTR